MRSLITQTFCGRFSRWLALIATVLLWQGSVQAFDLAAGEIVVDGRTVASMEEAEKRLKDGSTVYLGPGVYSRGIHIQANNVTLSGVEGTHFIDAAILGKGAIVTSGNNIVIENIECSNISVNHGNGSCIRHQGENLTVLGVYFHDSEQGILENKNTGTLTIKYSRFERLGNRGKSHAIYANGKALIVEDSSFIAMRNQGHSIKSRSLSTDIHRCLLTTDTGTDSRHVDVPNGGELVITDSIFHQTSSTSNRQVIGYGLENLKPGRTNSIEVRDNLVIMERDRGNEFLALPKSLESAPNFNAYRNVLVGRMYDLDEWKRTNTYYSDREQARLSAIELPELSQLPNVLSLIR